MKNKLLVLQNLLAFYLLVESDLVGYIPGEVQNTWVRARNFWQEISSDLSNPDLSNSDVELADRELTSVLFGVGWPWVYWPKDLEALEVLRGRLKAIKELIEVMIKGLKNG